MVVDGGWWWTVDGRWWEAVIEKGLCVLKDDGERKTVEDHG